MLVEGPSGRQSIALCEALATMQTAAANLQRATNTLSKCNNLTDVAACTRAALDACKGLDTQHAIAMARANSLREMGLDAAAEAMGGHMDAFYERAKGWVAPLHAPSHSALCARTRASLCNRLPVNSLTVSRASRVVHSAGWDFHGADAALLKHALTTGAMFRAFPALLSNMPWMDALGFMGWSEGFGKEREAVAKYFHYAILSQSLGRFRAFVPLVDAGPTVQSVGDDPENEEPRDYYGDTFRDRFWITSVHRSWYCESEHSGVGEAIRRIRIRLWNQQFVLRRDSDKSKTTRRGHAEFCGVPIAVGAETRVPPPLRPLRQSGEETPLPEGTDPRAGEWIMPVQKESTVPTIHRILKADGHDLRNVALCKEALEAIHPSEINFAQTDKGAVACVDCDGLLKAAFTMECWQGQGDDARVNVLYNRNCRLAMRLAQAEFAWKNTNGKGSFFAFATQKVRGGGILDADCAKAFEAKYFPDNANAMDVDKGNKRKGHKAAEMDFSRTLCLGRVFMVFPELLCLDVQSVFKDLDRRRGSNAFDTMRVEWKTIASVLIHATLQAMSSFSAGPDHRVPPLLAADVALPFCAKGTKGKINFSDKCIDLTSRNPGPGRFLLNADLGYTRRNTDVFLALVNATYSRARDKVERILEFMQKTRMCSEEDIEKFHESVAGHEDHDAARELCSDEDALGDGDGSSSDESNH